MTVFTFLIFNDLQPVKTLKTGKVVLHHCFCVPDCGSGLRGKLNDLRAFSPSLLPARVS
jgi:hypothetical protein